MLKDYIFFHEFQILKSYNLHPMNENSFPDLVEQISTALAHIADGICHALKVRVETILNSSSDLITLYATSNLIRFYQNIINQVNLQLNSDLVFIDQLLTSN